MSVLGHDVRGSFAARLAGRLYSATLTRVTTGDVDPSRAAGAPAITTATYTCDGIAFAYKADYVAGERIEMTDYRVTIILGSLVLVGDDAAKASLAMGGVTPDVDTVVRAQLAGAAGDGITVELVGDASDGAGTIVEVGLNVRVGFQPGVSTVADFEALIGDSTLLEVETAGTAGNVLLVGDELAATPLTGGADPTLTPATDVIPQPGDTISIPPPGEDATATATIIELASMTNAAATFRVQGQI